MARSRGRDATVGPEARRPGAAAVVDLLSAPVRGSSRLLSLAQGEVIVREGESGCAAFILLTGRGDVTVHGDLVNHIEPGELFGEIACLEGGTRTATVSAATECHVLEIKGEALRSELRRSPALLDRFLRAVTHRVRDISRRETSMRDEQRQLRTVLENLQPALERFRNHPNLAVDVRWQPLNVTSGDYYDVLELSPSRFLFALGDVMGHGAPTTPVVAAMRGQLHEAAEPDKRPHELLAHLHRHLQRHGPPNVFMTLTLVIVDVQDRVAEFAIGGPPCPLLCRGGECRPLTTQCGWTLGYPFSGISFQTERAQLMAGDVLCFYTDGVSDAACGPDDEQHRLGIERLADSVARVCGETLPNTADALLAEVDRFRAGWPACDDATVMVVRVR
jgi:serine phosphatase RsbU (regulator of sigma subunit)